MRYAAAPLRQLPDNLTPSAVRRRRVRAAQHQRRSSNMFAGVNGIRVDYVADGPAGAPWVTCVTGIAHDVTMWDPQAKALAASYRVLRYDLRGQGGGDSP